jgi:endonuclease-3
MDHPHRLSSRFLRRVYRRLTIVYDPPIWNESRSAIDELILTVLSQNTNDRNSHEGFRRLKERFSDWAEVERAPASSVAAAIKVSGLSRLKSRRIKDLLKRVHEERGEYSLEFLRYWDLDKANEYLLAIPGVGPKTAACVLAFSFGKPIFPVDTHILRVSKKMGILDEKCSADEAHRLLQNAVPKELTYPMHIMMIWHGRDTCHARNPNCAECALLSMCRYGRQHTRRRKPARPPRKLRTADSTLVESPKAK